jgi:hypothetical protein
VKWALNLYTNPEDNSSNPDFSTQAQQKKLLRHSMGLAAFARHHHMDVVDTFNMTAARYKDFLQGKCACHFHKVTGLSNAVRKRDEVTANLTVSFTLRLLLGCTAL